MWICGLYVPVLITQLPSGEMRTQEDASSNSKSWSSSIRFAYSVSFFKLRLRLRASHSGKGRALEAPAMVYTGTEACVESFMVKQVSGGGGQVDRQLKKKRSPPEPKIRGNFSEDPSFWLWRRAVCGKREPTYLKFDSTIKASASLCFSVGSLRIDIASLLLSPFLLPATQFQPSSLGLPPIHHTDSPLQSAAHAAIRQLSLPAKTDELPPIHTLAHGSHASPEKQLI